MSRKRKLRIIETCRETVASTVEKITAIDAVLALTTDDTARTALLKERGLLESIRASMTTVQEVMQGRLVASEMQKIRTQHRGQN